MNDIICIKCSAKLRVSDPSPAGKLVECPKCGTVFRAPEPRSEPLYSDVVCTDCGTVLRPPHPLRAGKLIQCKKCTTIFAVPGRVAEPAEARPRPVAPVSMPREDAPVRRPPTNRTNPDPAPLVQGDTGISEPRLSRPRRRRFRPKPAGDPAEFWGRVILGTIIGLGMIGCTAAMILFFWSRTRQVETVAQNSGSPDRSVERFAAQSANQTPRAPDTHVGDRRLPRQPPIAGGSSTLPAFPPSQLQPPYGAYQPPISGPPNAGAPGYQQGPMQRFQPPAAMLPNGLAGRQPNLPMQRYQPSDESQNVRQPKAQGGFQDWLQDLQQAKRQAANEGKDLFILFDGSDWCGYSIKLADDILFHSLFQQQVRQKFVLVFVDFPRSSAGRSAVRDPAQNARLKEEFGIEGFPSVVLADAQARAYANDGYRERCGPQQFLALLEQHQRVRIERDRLIDEVARAQGLSKLRAALRVVDFLRDNQITRYYSSLFREWAGLARTLDPNNKHTFNEQLFEIDWVLRVTRGDPENRREANRLVGELDDWKKTHDRFKNDDRGARVHILAVAFLAAGKQNELAGKYLRDAQVYHPTDPKLKEVLSQGAGLLLAGSGTGFVVSDSGHILTNYHVAGGPGDVKVRLPKVKEPVPARILAGDEKRDICLIRIKLPTGVRLQPLTIAGGRELRRGEQVAAFGFPLGDTLGTGLKLTTGVVSALPEEANEGMVLLDARVNPGNSGGPLCDNLGNVIGMVSAKSFSSRHVDSYGMAIPASDLNTFLHQHLKGYRPGEANRKGKPWDEVDELVSPSVLMILKEK